MKLLLFLSFSLALSSFGQEIKIYKDRCVDDGYRFLYHLPNDSILENNPPILIFLHGRSLSGSNLDLVRKYGVIDAIERGRSVPAIVLAPQVRMNETWNPRKVLNTIDYIFDKHPFDTNRVYMTGMSLGGYGTVDFASTYPEKLTAGVALCGGHSQGELCNLSKTNIWIQHGVLDRKITHRNSEEIFNAVLKCNIDANCFFTSYPDANHSDLAHEFYKDAIYEWMFGFDKTIENRRVLRNEKVILNYSHAKIGGKKSVKIMTRSFDSKSQTNKTHAVKEGESISIISSKYGVSSKQIIELNELTSDVIFPNQILIVR